MYRSGGKTRVTDNRRPAGSMPVWSPLLILVEELLTDRRHDSSGAGVGDPARGAERSEASFEGKPPKTVRQISVELYTTTGWQRQSKNSADARRSVGTTRGTWIDLTAERSST